ncbi:TonB-dependent siderophore receptor [Mucilaginibacter sp. UR6-11]|uniref:TonB-dependent receptor plug domain-containing protein n=1 Tax=Mucilaginibacter sp. UR6-11 TaxID=1435644 RepID=UPI001E4B8D91|nr:TonB-dependent receptor [Mucilaginibacter sp. UR6-11]MCC8426058.1 TonB-dependent receptor [Mucilaginibacter sp. UR6-11]
MKKPILYAFNCPGFFPGCFIGLIVLFLSNPLFAQSDTTKKLKEVKVKSSAIPQIQVIVPSQSLSANEFIHYNAFNVADAIRDFSGVIIKDYGGIGGLKTMSVRGLGANHTSILYDGVQINDAENGQIDLSKLNVNGIQRISLYNAQPPDILQTARAFAAASVLSIETIKPGLSAEKPYLVTAGIKAGSFGLINPYLQWQQRLSGKWAFIINSYTINADGGYNYLLFNGATNTKQKRVGSEVAIQQVDGTLYRTDSNSKFNLRINYYNSDRGLPSAVILYTPPPSGQKLYNRDLFLQSGYQHKWNSGLQLLINTKLSQNQLRYFDPQFPNTAGVLDQHFSQREYYQSAALTYAIKPNWQLSYAADLAVNNMNADLPAFRYPTRLTILNVLASNLILGDLTLQGSLLNTHLHETVRTGTTTPDRNIYAPTLIATVKPFADKNLQLRGFYKYIFRAPTFNDQYYGFTVNPDLRPEFTKQYDLGISYLKSLNGLFDYLGFTADAYYNNITNKIINIPSLYNGYARNTGKVEVLGLDAGLKTQAKLKLFTVTLSANYTYQQVQNVTDPAETIYLNQLPYTPKHTVAINAGISKGAFGLYYNQVISSSRYYGNDNNSFDYMPAYGISDASVVYKGAVNHFPVSLAAEVNNLFNTNYMVVQSYPMPGRSFRISFQITI